MPKHFDVTWVQISLVSAKKDRQNLMPADPVNFDVQPNFETNTMPQLHLKTKANSRMLATHRYRNARFLLFERCHGEVARFARAIQKSHSFASAYIAEMPTKRIGDKVARVIEHAFALESGWLDDDRSQSWDRRLREAIGGNIHPLDQGSRQDPLEVEHERWLSLLKVLPEQGPELIRTGMQFQQRLQDVQRQVDRLNQIYRAMLSKSALLYELDLERRLMDEGYVVRPPSIEQGNVFRVWHSDPDVKHCIQLSIALTFEPVMQFTPLPPSVRQAVAIPFVTEGAEHPQYLFLAVDERSGRFDASRIQWIDGVLWLTGTEGQKIRDLTSRLSLEPLFNSI